ncbi:putative aspartic protease [Aphelenchoides besseyi]|nr:putative aspartic protease [Aphelenchoides besseyi]KAI6211310.1 putative aspartic protease [Aphelenchoides besseyi]
MLVQLLVSTLILELTYAAIVQTPINRRESLDVKLIREKRYHELRVLNRVRIAKLSNPFVSRFDVARQPLYDYGDQLFDVRVSVGTPGQVIEVIPDTGEGNTWLIDRTCNGSASYIDCPSYCLTNKEWCALFCDSFCCSKNSTLESQVIDFQDPCAGKTLFDSSASSTYQSTDKVFRIPVGLGNVSGVLGQDTFTFGDPSSSTIQFRDTTFGQADRLSVYFAGAMFNGVLGLGYPKSEFEDAVPVIQHAVDLGVLDESVFTIWLQKEGAQSADKTAGALTFGGHDIGHCNSNITYSPLISKVVWWFDVVGVSANDKKITGNFVALASLPTPFILISSDMMADLVAVTNADYDYDYGFYQVDCSVTFSWTVFLNTNSKLELDQSNLLFTYPTGNCYLNFASYDGNVMAIDVVLGIPFLEGFCQTYDYGNGQIGFSKPL